MKLKGSKKLAKLNLAQNEIIEHNTCSKIKGGGYYCCARNKWIN